MSAKYRLRAYRSDAASLALRSSHGSFSPTAAFIDMGAVPADLTSTSLDELLRLNSMLLHERHHWLQHVGTSGGIYNSLLLNIEAGYVASMCDMERLTEDDLPLMLSPAKAHEDLLAVWEHVEAVRRSFFGCRIGTYRELDRSGSLSTRFLTEQLGHHLVKSVPGPDGGELRLPQWPDELFRDRPQYLVLQHRGWAFGARHLMEFSARVCEILKLGVDRARANLAPLDLSRYLVGVYRVAYDVFLDGCGTETRGVTTLVAAAVVCDLALNVIHPPVAPAFLASPGQRLIEFAMALKGFDFTQAVVIDRPDDVRSFVEGIHRHIEEEIGFSVGSVPKVVTGIFGHLEPTAMAASLFGPGDAAERPPLPDNAPLRWLASLWAEAARIRIDNPEFFALPSAAYMHDRPYFHTLFDRVAPPVIKRDGLMHPSRQETASAQWLAFSLELAVHADLLRGIIYCRPEELATLLARHGKALSPDTEMSDFHARLLFGAILAACHHGPLGTALTRRVAALLDREPPA